MATASTLKKPSVSSATNEQSITLNHMIDEPVHQRHRRRHITDAVNSSMTENGDAGKGMDLIIHKYPEPLT